MYKFFSVAVVLLVALVVGIKMTNTQGSVEVNSTKKLFAESGVSPEPVILTVKEASLEKIVPPPRQLQTRRTEQYGDPAPHVPPLPPAERPAPQMAAVKSTTTVFSDRPEQEQLAEAESSERARLEGFATSSLEARNRKPVIYDQYGQYIESGVKIDYGEWGEGARNDRRTGKTPKTPGYTQWQKAQESWNNPQL